MSVAHTLKASGKLGEHSKIKLVKLVKSVILLRLSYIVKSHITALAFLAILLGCPT